MRILFLAPRVPYPPNRGDRIRSWHLLQYFARHGRVDLACTTDEPITTVQATALKRICERVEVAAAPAPRWWSATRSLLCGRSATEGVFSSDVLRETLQDWRRDTVYDLVFVYCSSMTPYLKSLHISAERVLVDLVDVDSRKWQDYAANSRGLRSAVYRLEQSRVERLERQSAALSHRLIVTTKQEARAAAEVCPRATISVLRNGVDLDYFGEVSLLTNETCARPTCIFTGVLDYQPNVQAVQWFVEKVWGGVRSRFPTARFLIVGRSPTRTVQRLAATAGVELRADVADVRPSLNESRVVVAPLQIARGIQNKILEGMAARRAVIASPQAATGLDAIPGSDLLTADTVQNWQTAITRLFDADEECRSIALAGRIYVEQHHHWDDQLRLLDGWLNDGDGSQFLRQVHPAPAVSS